MPSFRNWKKRTKAVLAAAVIVIVCAALLAAPLLSPDIVNLESDAVRAALNGVDRAESDTVREIDTAGLIPDWERDYYTPDERLIPDDAMQKGVPRTLPAGMEKIAEDGGLELYFNEETTEVAVLSKESGAVWTSAPQDSELDKVAQGNNLQKLSALLSIDYYTPEGSLQSYDTANHSVAYGNFTVEPMENGVRVHFVIGNVKDVTYKDVPNIISRERFEAFLAKMDPKRAGDVKGRYRLYSLSQAESDAEAEELKRDYPSIEQYDIYVLRDKEDLLLPMILESFEQAGYTQEDLEKDNRDNFIEDAVEERQVFEVAVELYLEDGAFCARVDGETIQSPQQTPVYYLHLLPFFGAANLRSRGYMLVPDASGGLIYLNSFSSLKEEVRLPMYGADKALRQDGMGNKTMQNTMPVFGMKNGEDGFFAVIEEGDACAAVHASIPGLQNSYNSVWAGFSVNPKDSFATIEGMAGGMVYSVLYPNQRNTGDYSVRYTFYSGEEASYSHYAEEYRAYLQARGAIPSQTTGRTSLPFLLETIAVVDKTDAFLGLFRYDKQVAVTTFSQTEEMVSLLREAGVGDLMLRLSGWCNGGVNQELPDSLSVASAAGGEKGLTALLEAMEAQDVRVYADIQFQTVRNPGLFWNKKKNLARYLGNVYALTGQYDIPSQSLLINRPSEYLLSPSRLSELVQSTGEEMDSLALPGLSCADLGRDLYSDFNESANISRDEAKGLVMQALDILGGDRSMMVETGNIYALKYADAVSGMAIGGNGYKQINESVPFVQMVLHGYMDYAGDPLNQTDDLLTYSLQCVEYGAIPYVRWTHAQSSNLKNTNHTEMFAACYRNTFDMAVDYYERLNRETGAWAGEQMIDHQKLAENVYKTTYEGGGSVLVNYNTYDVRVDGVLVEALDWAVVTP